MQFMFFAGHFAFSVIYVLGGRVSVSEILDAMGRANQVKFVHCAGKITVTFSNAAGRQHYEMHGCGISIINV